MKKRWYLWITDWWDGPIAGIMWHTGWFRYFECYMDEPDKYRAYHVHKLTPIQVAREIVAHGIFVLWVKKIKWKWRWFYKIFKPKIKRYDKAPIIASFTEYS